MEAFTAKHRPVNYARAVESQPTDVLVVAILAMSHRSQPVAVFIDDDGGLKSDVIDRFAQCHSDGWAKS